MKGMHLYNYLVCHHLKLFKLNNFYGKHDKIKPHNHFRKESVMPDIFVDYINKSCAKLPKLFYS